MKIRLELNIIDDEGKSVFINFWNPIDGNDVIVEVKDEKLFRHGKEITLTQFINQVKKSFENAVS